MGRWACRLGAVVVMSTGCADDGGNAGPEEGTGGGTDGSGDPQTDSISAGSTGAVGSNTGAMTSSTGVADDTGTGSDDTGPPVIPFEALCFEAPPQGAQSPPAPPEYTGGECPALVPGFNTLPTVTGDREFLLVAPTDVQRGEVLPVIFLWHWLGGDAQDFADTGQVQAAADEYRFIAAIPEAAGDLTFKWPYSTVDSDARMQEEFVFFDDMLACIAQTYTIEPNCVSSVGVSAGALWTSQLAGGRGDYLSSIVVLSGGTGGLVKPWTPSPHIMPALVLWGGPDDMCFVNFEETSKDLEENLVADGHSILECVHNCEHAEPPFDQPEGTNAFAPMWQYVLAHPYWLEDGESPWDAGLPENTPPWCSMGAGTATPREGECGPSQCQ